MFSWSISGASEMLALSTQVLNLSSGSEEIVDPENVWNVIPDRAYRSPKVRCSVGLGKPGDSWKGCSELSFLLPQHEDGKAKQH